MSDKIMLIAVIWQSIAVKNFKILETCIYRIPVSTELCICFLKFSHAGSHVKCYVRLFEDLFLVREKVERHR